MDGYGDGESKAGQEQRTSRVNESALSGRARRAAQRGGKDDMTHGDGARLGDQSGCAKPGSSARAGIGKVGGVMG